MVKNPPAVRGIWIQSLGQGDTLGNGVATLSNVLARRITWTEEAWCLAVRIIASIRSQKDYRHRTLEV